MSRAIVLGFFVFAGAIQAWTQATPAGSALNRLDSKMQAALIQNPALKGPVVVFEVALPSSPDETKKMNGNALLLIRSIASSEDEAKTAAVYLEESALAHQLTRIGKVRRKIGSPNAFQEDSLYFIPLRLLNPKDEVSVLLQKTGSILEVGNPPGLDVTTASFLTGRESELSMSFRSKEWKKLANREFPGMDFSTKITIEEIDAYLTKQVPPHYPPEARLQRITGAAILRVRIDASGKVKNISLVQGEPILAKAAADAVRQWEYRQHLINGQQVEVETQIIVNFELGG